MITLIHKGMGSPWVYDTCRQFQLQADYVEYARRHAEFVFSAWDYVEKIILHDQQGTVLAVFEPKQNGTKRVHAVAAKLTVNDLAEMLKS